MNRVRVTTGLLLLFVALSATVFLVMPKNASATAGINQELSFEGKVVTTAGLNIPDGTYNMEFKIYSGGTATGGGTLVWTEDYLVGGLGSGITFSSGTFQTALGSVCSLSGGSCESYTNTGVNWDTYPLYLSMQMGNTTSCTVTTSFNANCGGDGEMSPYILLTSTPYSFNSNELGGLGAAAFGQLSTSQTWTGVNTIKNTATGALAVQNAGGTPVLNVDTSNQVVDIGTSTSAANRLQVENGTYSSNLVLLNDGVTGTPAAYPNSYTPELSVIASEVSGSRPLFFGYNNGAGAYAGFLTSGACGAYTQMCLDLGNGSTAYTALENSGTTLNLGGGIDGNFTNVSFQNTGNVGITNSLSAASISIAATAVPTASLATISNTGFANTSAGVSGLTINYTGGAAAVEASGETVNLTPGTTSGGTWNGLDVIAGATGAVAGVTENGLKLVGPTSQGAGNEYGITIGSGWDAGLNITAATVNPPTPSANTLDVYALNIAGRTLLNSESSSGVNFAYQPSFFQQSILLCTLNSTTTIAGVGGACTISDSATTAVATTQATGVTVDLRTTAVANGAAGVWQTVSNYFVGNVANESNGFFFDTKFGLPDASYGAGATGSDMFFGLSDQATAATMVNSANPAGNYAGIQYSTSRGDTNWMCVTKNNVTQVTPVSTGVAFTATDTYDVYVYTPPEGTTISMEIINDSTGAIGTCNISTDLPISTTAMRPDAFIGTLTTTARNIDFSRMYVESNL